MWLIIVIILIVIIISIGKDYYPLLLAKFMSPTRNDVSMDIMEGVEFENFCAKLLLENGYTNVRTTQASGDHGIDILASKDGYEYAIQCKRYRNDVGNKAVQEAYTGREIYNANYAVVMTNRYFTPQARQEAERLGVRLWDRDKISAMQLKAPIKTENNDEPPVTQVVDEPQYLLPAGVYIVGETIEPGNYVLRAIPTKTALISTFNSYDDYKTRNILNVRNFTDEYRLVLRDNGECIDIENCIIERKL